MHSPALATTAAYVAGLAVLLPVPVITAPLFPAPRLGFAGGLDRGGLSRLSWAPSRTSGGTRRCTRVGASRAAIFMNLQPVVGVLLRMAQLLGESIEPAEIVGGLAVLGGVALTTRAGSGRRGPPRPAPPPSRAS